MYTTRILNEQDRPELEALLLRHADTSMIIRGNLLDAGVVDRGARFQGTYAGGFDGTGMLRAVAVHYQNGNLFAACDEQTALEPAVRMAVAASGRPIKGAIGPRALVRCMRTLLGLEAVPVQIDSDEGLYALDLAELRVPPLLAEPDLLFRAPRPEDRQTMVRWFRDYELEALGAEDGPEVLREAERRFDGLARDEPCLLTHGGVPCATARFNARLPDQVQVGGVYTPPEARSRGYARAAVAASLLAARAKGVRRAILFTGEENLPAIKAYRALGFRRIGDFNITLFR
jgi:uncharacterized protein